MLLQSVAQLGKEPRIPEPEVVQVSLASIQAPPDPREDLSRIVALDEIREFLGKGIELFQECRPPLILVHGPEVTPESTATASRENVARVMAQLALALRKLLDEGYSVTDLGRELGITRQASTTYSSGPSDEGGYPADEASRTETFCLVVPTGFEPVSPP
jgi:hypothetical protein